MKRFIYLSLLTIALSSTAKAATYNPDGFIIDGTVGDIDPAADGIQLGCTVTPCEISYINGGNNKSVWPFLGDLAYKNDFDSYPGDSGHAAAGYNTTYFNDAGYETTSGDPSYASISWNGDGGSVIDCSSDCWLVVKGGRHEPARYLFDLAMLGWDGMQERFARTACATSTATPAPCAAPCAAPFFSCARIASVR